MATYFLMATVSCPLMFAMFLSDLMAMLHAPLSHLAALYYCVLVRNDSSGPFLFAWRRSFDQVTVRPDVGRDFGRRGTLGDHPPR